jgi:threonine-phosphate decarboxylase
MMTTEASALALGAHGGNGRAVAEQLGLDPSSMIDLSASLNPFAVDTLSIVRDVVAGDVHAVGSYPDERAAHARLAGVLAVDPDQLVLTNGGAEAIALVAAVEGQGSVIAPEFSLYERHLTTVADSAPRWRSNPSNPLGRLAGPDEEARVWDEAFYPLATGTWSRGDASAWRLGSLTKLWSCPGLRIGYVIAPSARLADAVRARQPRWAVNGIALAALPALLDATDLSGWTAAIRDRRARFNAALRNLGFDSRETDANWVLVHHAADPRTALARHRVVIRDCTSFGLPGVFRVALPAAAQYEAVLAAFAAVS